MSTRHRAGSERERLELFRALPGDLAPRDAQDLMAFPFFSLAKSHRSTPIEFRSGDVAIRVEAVPEYGMATIWDADVLIWAASQIVQARDAGLRTSRLMAATPYEISGSRRRSTGCNRRRSRRRCANQSSDECAASPGSTNGRNAQMATAILEASS
jgi:plasmid replication initiation protein